MAINVEQVRKLSLSGLANIELKQTAQMANTV
jgi:hypothetical protein